jgi:O-acetyl-ADP-ribose deacetylase (regulator of RNase III)
LNLESYRSLIDLDESFEAPNPAPASERDRTDLVDRLIEFLKSEHETGLGVRQDGSISSYMEKRRLLRFLLTLRRAYPFLPDWFHETLGRILQRETIERGLIDAQFLPRFHQSIPGIIYTNPDRCALWRGDITTLRIDAIVNAANSRLLGCFIPFHTCIDNVIHSAAGPRVREDCLRIIQKQGTIEETGQAKITRAYHLPSKYILHTVGPIIEPDKEVLPLQEDQLSACYRSCLDLSLCKSGIRSIAFCCISTGVFGFHQEPAARVALRTVAQWLAQHPNALDLIVFNVFRQEDFEVYENLLNERMG